MAEKSQWDKVVDAVHALEVAAVEYALQQHQHSTGLRIGLDSELDIARKENISTRSQLYFEIGGLIGENNHEKKKNP